MYFNLDREKKQKILDYYKKDLLDYERKKKEVKQAKIQEELNLLHQNELKEKESEQKIIEEEKRKKKALMDEYLEMLRNTKILDGGYRYKPKNRDIINKNWGKGKEELKENKKDSFYTIDYHRSCDSDALNSMSESEKVKQILKPVDCMNKFITDVPNEKEVNSYFLEQKQNKQDLYKKILYKQHNDYIQNNLNTYGTDDVLILKQKKKNLVTENPYKKYEYRIGNSFLERNPILNPENNMKYNKYFKEPKFNHKH